jgi:hypothetical protein
LEAEGHVDEMALVEDVDVSVVAVLEALGGGVVPVLIDNAAKAVEADVFMLRAGAFDANPKRKRGSAPRLRFGLVSSQVVQSTQPPDCLVSKTIRGNSSKGGSGKRNPIGRSGFA